MSCNCYLLGLLGLFIVCDMHSKLSIRGRFGLWPYLQFCIFDCVPLAVKLVYIIMYIIQILVHISWCLKQKVNERVESSCILT